MAYIIVIRWILLSRKASQLNVLGMERGVCLRRVWRGSCCDACVRLNTAVHDWMSCSLCCDLIMLWLAHMQPFYGHCKPHNLLPQVLWRCWLGGRKGVQSVRNWVMGCWQGYVSRARCRLAYGPADATATHGLLLRYNPDWFCLSGTASSG